MRSSLLLCLLFPFLLSAQREADCLAIGYCNFHPTPDCPPPRGSAIYKFNEEGIEFIDEYAGLNISTSYSRAAFSNRHTGELIFASNGWRLVSRSGQVQAHKLWRNDILWPGDNPDTTGVLNTLGPLFLNDPGDSTKAYLFYGQYIIQNWGGLIGFQKLDRLFTYAYLDIPTQSLISKGNVLLDEVSAPGDMAACRHANGRDWWIIKPGAFDDENFIGMLGPKEVRLEKQKFAALQHRPQGGTFTYFNQNGDKMIRYLTQYNELQEFDFDRCAGELSNLKVHDLSDSLNKGFGLDWNACTISPDGTKFYVRRSPLRGGGTLQYDLQTSGYTHITMFDSSPQLTPNYRQILLSSSVIKNDSAIRTLSTIYEPNKPGLECNFVEHTDTIINIPAFISPSCFANFRLGRLEGSPCDTITGVTQVKKEDQMQVYPNPAREVLYVEFPYPNGKSFQVQIVDLMGKVVYAAELDSGGGSVQINQMGIHPGLYVLRAEREGKVYHRRFVVN